MYAIRFGYQWMTPDGIHCIDRWRFSMPLSQDVPAGATHEQSVAVHVPPPGRYRLCLFVFQAGTPAEEVDMRLCELAIQIPNDPCQEWLVREVERRDMREIP